MRYFFLIKVPLRIIMKKGLLLIQLFSLLFCIYGHAQSLTPVIVKGTVLDAATNDQLVGATIQIPDLKLSASARLDGSFGFKLPAAGAYRFRFRYIGYVSKDTTIEIYAGKRLNIRLYPTHSQLNTITIADKVNHETEGSAKRIEQSSPNELNVVSARAIQLSPDITVANVLQRVSGVSVERSGSGDGRYAIIRGMDKRYNYTLVNGIKIPSPDSKNRYVPLDIFPADLVERIEVSKTLTPDMEGDAIGGVVNMVMKNAPNQFYFNASASTGYSENALEHGFNAFPVSAINKQSPFEQNGAAYLAKPSDFTRDNLNYTNKNFTPNTMANLSIGNRFFDKKLGVMLGGSYQNTYRSYTNIFVPGDQYIDQTNAVGVLQIKHANFRDYSTQVTRTALNTKIDYNFNDKNTISGYALYTILDDAQSRLTRDTIQTGASTRTGYGTGEVWYYGRSKYQHQSILNTTLDGKHMLLPGLKFNWIGAYSLAQNNVPDQAEYEYDTGFYADGTNPKPYQHGNTISTRMDRIWQDNTDKDLSGYANLAYSNKLMEVPFTVTVGGMYRDKKRNNRYQDYILNTDGTQQQWIDIYHYSWSVSNPNGSPANYNTYRATEDVTAGYGMLKFKIGNLETLAGARLESTDLDYNTDALDSQAGKTGTISYSDVLPSVNFKYILNSKTNLRLSYFASINRPTFYEIVPGGNVGDDYTETGNALLKHATADNFDFRYELFPKANEQILLGAFYKKIYNPIEYGFTGNKFDTYEPQNFGDATNYGFEAVFEKYLGNFGLRANYTYTNSSITTTKFQTFNNQTVAQLPLQTRPLQGQSANIANAALLYKNAKKGIDVQIAWQFTGERIALVSPVYEFDQWQKGLNTIDLSAEKRFKKHFAVFAKVQNLLNTPDETFIKQPTTGNPYPVSYEVPGSSQTLASKSVYGQNYQLGLRYTLQ
jgi:outer membrane receptor protein involved in Fe transport